MRRLCAGSVGTKPAWTVRNFSTNVSALGVTLTPNPVQGGGGGRLAGEQGGICELQMLHVPLDLALDVF